MIREIFRLVRSYAHQTNIPVVIRASASKARWFKMNRLQTTANGLLWFNLIALFSKNLSVSADYKMGNNDTKKNNFHNVRIYCDSTISMYASQ
jgi:hypothetical protein